MNTASLRDQIAMAALTGLLGNPALNDGTYTHNNAARDAFDFADAMLTERGLANDTPATAPEASEVLPQKWAIERTPENADMVNDWAESQDDAHQYGAREGYVHSEHVDLGGNAPRVCRLLPDLAPGFEPITTAQFRRLVAKQ